MDKCKLELLSNVDKDDIIVANADTGSMPTAQAIQHMSNLRTDIQDVCTNKVIVTSGDTRISVLPRNCDTIVVTLKGAYLRLSVQQLEQRIADIKADITEQTGKKVVVLVGNDTDISIECE